MHAHRLLTLAAAATLAALVACNQTTTKPASSEEAEEAAEAIESPEVQLPENAKPLSEILAGVQSKGYDPVIEIELDDDGWEIDAFKGKDVVEIDVDPVSGEITSEEAETGGKPLAEILKAVEAQGYGPILEVELDDDGWEISAVKDGEEVSLTADTKTGEIRSAEEEEENESAEENEQEEKEEKEK